MKITLKPLHTETRSALTTDPEASVRGYTVSLKLQRVTR